MNRTRFSVLLTVYEGDDPNHLELALESTVHQTAAPDEIVVVLDGPITSDVKSLLTSYKKEHSERFLFHQLPENQGRGAAADIGLSYCRYDLVAIMSADDVNVSDRFEHQLNFLQENQEVDVAGGYISEFDEDPSTPIAIREVPTEPQRIRDFARSRNPMNEVTVMFRKKAVLDAGGYRSVDRMEDYDLWGRLLTSGATLANIPSVLVRVRGGSAMHERRGGLEYAREEVRQQVDFLRWGLTGLPRCAFNICTRVPLRLMPNSIRSWVYRKYARSLV